MRWVAATGSAALIVLSLGGTVTLSGWTAADVGTPANSAQTGALAFAHAYQSSVCAAGPRVSASAACAGGLAPNAGPPAAATDAISNTGTVPAASLTQSVVSPSCAPVTMKNTQLASDPLLPRYDTAFAPTGGPGGDGAVSFGSGTGYAAGVIQQTIGGSYVPPLISISDTVYQYGYAVSFKTTTGEGQIFGLGSAPSLSGNPSFSRSLALHSGALSFTERGLNTATTAGPSLADGRWHSVYVSVIAESKVLVLNLALTTTYTTNVTVYVDGTKAASSSTNGQLARDVGYWFLGPTYTGAVSNVVVYNSTSAPTTTPPVAPFAGATEWWQLNDDGTSTYGSTPSWLATPACSQVDVEFSSTTPSDGIPIQSLASFSNGVPRPIAPPGPGATQLLTVKTSRGASYSTAVSGLRLYVPITIAETTNPTSTGWQLAFTWSSSSSVFIA